MLPNLETSNQLFKAFADPTRLRILNLLRKEELCVCHLVEVLEAPQSRVSRHLAYLKRVGLIQSREEGTWNYYCLATPKEDLPFRLLNCVTSYLSDIDLLKKDLKKIQKFLVEA